MQDDGAVEDDGFTFVDLFAGIGGFHSALSGLGGRAVFASEIDKAAAAVYERNWGLRPDGDIVPLTEARMAVPASDLVVGGFPCQPFSKSGAQRGMDETRGTLFFNICRVLEAHRPPVIVLENVRNLSGATQRSAWRTIIRSLRDLGYLVASEPAVMSPHLLPPSAGGSPQVRERAFITGTWVGAERAWSEPVEPVADNRPTKGWDPRDWDLVRDLPMDNDSDALAGYGLSDAETRWIDTWNDLLGQLPGGRLPGFPLWADEFRAIPDIGPATPAWKAALLAKNSEFYLAHRAVIDAWKDRNDNLSGLIPSRRKLEWQAGDARPDLWQCALQFRPSGIRAKKPTYMPALVAVAHTSVHGPSRRRLTPREAARLQGFPDTFDFGDQPDAATYKQLGNAVHSGVVRHILIEHAKRDLVELRPLLPGLVRSCGL